MIRRLTAIFLLLAFSAQAFSQSLIVFDYYLHPSSYASHCENKARPMMHCNGKCQLMKKLRAEHRHDQQEPTRKLDSRNEIISSNSYFGKALAPLTVDVIKVKDWQKVFAFQNHYTAIYHPPRCRPGQYILVFVR